MALNGLVNLLRRCVLGWFLCTLSAPSGGVYTKWARKVLAPALYQRQYWLEARKCLCGQSSLDSRQWASAQGTWLKAIIKHWEWNTSMQKKMCDLHPHCRQPTAEAWLVNLFSFRFTWAAMLLNGDSFWMSCSWMGSSESWSRLVAAVIQCFFYCLNFYSIFNFQFMWVLLLNIVFSYVQWMHHSDPNDSFLPSFVFPIFLWMHRRTAHGSSSWKEENLFILP